MQWFPIRSTNYMISALFLLSNATNTPNMMRYQAQSTHNSSFRGRSGKNVWANAEIVHFSLAHEASYKFLPKYCSLEIFIYACIRLRHSDCLLRRMENEWLSERDDGATNMLLETFGFVRRCFVHFTLHTTFLNNCNGPTSHDERNNQLRCLMTLILKYLNWC